MTTFLVFLAAQAAPVHVTVARDPSRFRAWPANHGLMWRWGDEILFGFMDGPYKAGMPGGHNIDDSQPYRVCLARSLDAGATWAVEYPGILDDPRSNPATGDVGDCPGGIDFAHPDFAMICLRSAANPASTGPTSNDPATRAWFQVSTDRGRSWSARWRLPTLGYPGNSSRTDYLVKSANECRIFMTMALSPERVTAARTVDGGKTWTLDAQIGAPPEHQWLIMPSTIRLSDTTLLSAVRGGDRATGSVPLRRFIDVYRSKDDGKSWTFVNRPVDTGSVSGNPPSMIRLADGRVALTYGDRRPPYTMAAVLSSDGGQTWGAPVELRSGAGHEDIGYPRSVQRADGKVVTAYYWNDGPADPTRNRVCYIAATIWDPGASASPPVTPIPPAPPAPALPASARDNSNGDHAINDRCSGSASTSTTVAWALLALPLLLARKR